MSFHIVPTLPSDLSPGGDTTYRGYIDSLDARTGVRGWALNLDNAYTPPVLALRVGPRTAARLTPDRRRDDIAEAVGKSISPGFLFGPEVLQQAASLATHPYDLLTVCIDGTDLELDSAVSPTFIGDLDIPPQAGPVPPPAVSPGVQASLDRLLLIPGLGCMIEGWVLTPYQPAVDFRLRLGGVAFEAVAGATYRKSRPDLLAAYPHADAMISRAGFVALLTSDQEIAHPTSPVLQIVFADQSMVNLEFPASLARVLGHTATASDALRFFPSLACEPFFARFAAAAARAETASLGVPVAIQLEPAEKLLIHVLPEDRSDRFLLFDNVAAALGANNFAGVAFITASDDIRAEAPWHLRDLLSAHRLPASLFAVPRAGAAFALLSHALRATGAKRFAFLDAGIFPTPPAYRNLADYLRGTAKAPLFLAAIADPVCSAEPGATPTARSFAWNSQAFLRWAATAPAFLGGHFADNGLPLAGAKILPDRVRSSVPLMLSPIEEAVNEVLYAAPRN